MNIVITGASRGLGLELARLYAARGDTVIAGVRKPAAAAALAATGAAVLAAEMGSIDSVASFGAAVLEASGGRVDVLINNAGVDGTAFGGGANDRDVLTLDPDNFRQQMEVNAVGPMMLVRSLLPGLREAQGRIVNVTSQIGSMVVSSRMGRDVGYAVSKAALNMITVKQAWRLRDDGITAIALHPGYLKTDMGGAAAELEPDFAARSIVEVIDGLSLERSGSFLRWDGSEHPW